MVTDVAADVTSILEDTGTTLPAQIAAMGTGGGAISWTYTLTSSVDAAPIADAAVWVTTDYGGSNVVASQRTATDGTADFQLDPGTYYVWRSKSGWSFTNPDTEVVS
jgi:hypothetical protein